MCALSSSRVASSRRCLLASSRHNARIFNSDASVDCSAMAGSCELKDHLMKKAPLFRSRLKRRPTGGSEGVVLALAASGRFLPSRRDQFLALQLVEQGIDRPLLPDEDAIGLLVDLTNDVVPIAAAAPEDAEDQHGS